ncbi:MAG: hypothetical protein CO119_01130 [Flavobacteriales bacterium CG_4_9_14_3_um_filter_40_17]|nr:MAG: hypothetical protein CO119_01130 [Flavobacteriales bacterium CG_4_9_14_3_um_filter_40_17]
MNKILIQPPYFGDIAHYTAMAKSDEIYFESADNFQKQTARNRTHIMGANGKLMLNIPLKHSRGGDRQLTRDIRIENNFPWQDLHWKSLCSAYRSSPYFEFFEDDLQPLFIEKQVFLLDFNMKTILLMFDLIKIGNIETFHTDEYTMAPDGSYKDYRYLIQSKKVKFKNEPYQQVFDKLEFLPNLCILDLLFNLGPQTKPYLLKQRSL